MSKCIPIDSCDKCPYSRTPKAYTPDSFENEWHVDCSKLERRIAEYHDSKSKPTQIPDDCPLTNFVGTT